MISNVDQLIEQANLIENETERVIFVMNYFLQNVKYDYGYLKESYFRKLYKLEIHDKVSVFYDCYEYVYEVINTYKVEKTGTVKVIRNN
ncbi:MAG: hypothetical protein PUD25_00750, partial [Bacilli bacterium]|nr:hypothetical protein [Bacilli bacterium]